MCVCVRDARVRVCVHVCKDACVWISSVVDRCNMVCVHNFITTPTRVQQQSLAIPGAFANEP